MIQSRVYDLISLRQCHRQKSSRAPRWISPASDDPRRRNIPLVPLVERVHPPSTVSRPPQVLAALAAAATASPPACFSDARRAWDPRHRFAPPRQLPPLARRGPVSATGGARRAARRGSAMRHWRRRRVARADGARGWRESAGRPDQAAAQAQLLEPPAAGELQGQQQRAPDAAVADDGRAGVGRPARTRVGAARRVWYVSFPLGFLVSKSASV